MKPGKQHLAGQIAHLGFGPDKRPRALVVAHVDNLPTADCDGFCPTAIVVNRVHRAIQENAVRRNLWFSFLIGAARGQRQREAGNYQDPCRHYQPPPPPPPPPPPEEPPPPPPDDEPGADTDDPIAEFRPLDRLLVVFERFEVFQEPWYQEGL